uniref:Transmembrane protein 208 n=1 Tax=Trichuris muris TaxID=70415 RepID=A0A5S6QVA1_TRIMR
MEESMFNVRSVIELPEPPVFQEYRDKRIIVFSFEVDEIVGSKNGKRQAVDERTEAVGCTIHLCFRYFWSGHIPCFSISWILYAVSVAAQVAALCCLKSMARTYYSDSGSLVYGGLDLNMEGGVGEYCKDVIIFSTVLQLLSIVHRNFWAFYILAPLYTGYKIWVTVLMPWFFAPGEDSDKLEKKRLKNQRKLMRVR